MSAKSDKILADIAETLKTWKPARGLSELLTDMLETSPSVTVKEIKDRIELLRQQKGTSIYLDHGTLSAVLEENPDKFKRIDDSTIGRADRDEHAIHDLSNMLRKHADRIAFLTPAGVLEISEVRYCLHDDAILVKLKEQND
jgi:hypothetical protein